MNSISLLVFFTIIPIILILLFVYQKDKNKEPLHLLIELFGLGIISCFLVLFLSDILGLFLPFMRLDTNKMDFITVLLYSFIGVALVEEFCKWIMVYLRGYNNKQFDELYDIIVYSVFVSLGFAFFENILYVFIKKNLRTALLRAISAIPGHACDSIFMGYYLSTAKQFQKKGRKVLERNNIVLSIIIPTVLHGIYDFCILSGYHIFIVVFVIFVIYLYIISIKKLKEISLTNKKINYENNFCKECGSKLEENICKKCGSRQE